MAAFFSQEKGPISAEKPDPIFEFINRQTSPSARLMFLNINFGFWCEREYLADSAFEASQMNELSGAPARESGLASLLADLGITHVLYANYDWKIAYPRYLFDFLDRQAVVAAQTEDGRLTPVSERARVHGLDHQVSEQGAPDRIARQLALEAWS